MMRYRIEVYILGFIVGVYETNKHSEAKRIYWLHNNRLDRWTQLYIDGETGSKEWMDRTLGGGREHGYLAEDLYLTAMAYKTKKGRDGE